MQEWRIVKNSCHFAGAPSRWSDRREERECSAKGEVCPIVGAQCPQQLNPPSVHHEPAKIIPNLSILVITERRKIIYYKKTDSAQRIAKP